MSVFENIKNKNWKLAVSIIGIALVVLYFINSSNFFKITDPSDPRFEISEFTFEDYGTDHEKLSKILNQIFPKGTEKQFIDQVLVDHIGAGYKLSDSGTHIYRAKAVHHIVTTGSRICDTWTIRVQYNANQELTNLVLMPLCF